MRMPPVQRAAYMDLLAAEWLEGPFDRDTALLLCRGVPEADVDAVLAAKFVKNDGGLYFNRRLEDERDKQAEKSRKGKKAARARWSDDGDKCQTDAKADTKPHANGYAHEVCQNDARRMPSDSDSDSDSVFNTDSDSIDRNTTTTTDNHLEARTATHPDGHDGRSSVVVVGEVDVGEAREQAEVLLRSRQIARNMPLREVWQVAYMAVWIGDAGFCREMVDAMKSGKVEKTGKYVLTAIRNRSQECGANWDIQRREIPNPPEDLKPPERG